MLRLPFLETRFLNRQYVLRIYGVGRQQRVSTLSRNSFKIVQATHELDSREEKVVDTL